VIGARITDVQMVQNMAIRGIQYNPETMGWKQIVKDLTVKARVAEVVRTTKETDIKVSVNLDEQGGNDIKTGLGFFDHMVDSKSNAVWTVIYILTTTTPLKIPLWL
jgi:imidazoleglycerol-phosphate dehydratase/histidinol-phosphatase